MSTILIDKNTLLATGIDRLPKFNEFQVEGVDASKITKEITYDTKIPKVDENENQIFLLSQPDKEISVPTPKTVQTIEATKEDGTPNTPIIVKKTRQIPLTDSSGQQIKYFPTNTRYEQQETGIDEQGNPTYEPIEIVEVSDTPIFCWTTEEYEEQKVDGNNNPLFTTEILEDVTTYEAQPNREILESDPEWNESLDVIEIDTEIPKTVSLSQSSEHFTYEEIESNLSSLKQIKITELYQSYQKELNGQVISTLLGADGLNIIFPYTEKDRDNYRSIGITFALDSTQTQSIIGSDSHGKYYIQREDFMALTKEFQNHEVGMYMKFKQKETEVLAETCNTIDLVRGVIW